jgi:hypothetical protein
MSLLPKISKLSKIPELLKHKREEEEHQRKKKRQKEKERNSKFIIDEVTISQASKSNMEVEMPTKPPEVPEIIKEKDEGKGIKIDLRA